MKSADLLCPDHVFPSSYCYVIAITNDFKLLGSVGKCKGVCLVRSSPWSNVALYKVRIQSIFISYNKFIFNSNILIYGVIGSSCLNKPE